MFIENLLTAAILTVIIELQVIVLYKDRTFKLIIASIIINLISNISMNYLLIKYFLEPSIYPLALLIFEILVVCIEALVYFLVTRNKKVSIILSLVANILSFIIGIIIL